MSYNALRSGRYSATGNVYHVTTITRNRAPTFGDIHAGRVLVRELMSAQTDGLAQTLCFVVMPDHLHWLLTLENGTLAGLTKRVKARSARALGRPTWQANFHDHAVRSEESLRDIARYIVANPLRAGLVARIGDYPLWDSIWL